MDVVWPIVWALTGVVGTIGALEVRARLRYARRLTFFRCRIGPSARRWRRGARWWLGRRSAAWAGGVLWVSAGPFRSFLTPVATGVPQTARVRRLEGRARGLGTHPVSLRTADAGRSLEIAVPQACVGELVGPFFAAALPDPPAAPRDEGIG
jgi:hypothetical protein